MMSAKGMHRIILARALCALCLAAPVAARAQVSGNAAYGQNGYGQQSAKARAEQAVRAERTITKEDLPPTPNSMFAEASVLMNVKADEYVAVFGLAQEAPTVAEAQSKMTVQVSRYTDALKLLGIKARDLYVDFITEPKVYTYDIKQNSATERLAGFELKKNVSIRYTDPALLDKLVAAAAQVEIYDLIKVDYIVKDIPAVEGRLRAEAAAVLKQKLAGYQQLLGVHAAGPAAIYADRVMAHYPADLYDGYTAAESEMLTRPAARDNYTIRQARKGRTFYFNGLDANGFDKVINPVILEPVVQFTAYLKVRYQAGH